MSTFHNLLNRSRIYLGGAIILSFLGNFFVAIRIVSNSKKDTNSRLLHDAPILEKVTVDWDIIVAESNDEWNKENVRTIHNMEKHHFSSKCSRNLAFTPLSITLVTQTTFERLPVLTITCKRWSAPISVAVYMSSLEFKFLERIKQTFRLNCPNVMLFPYEGIDENEKINAFPINKLRNLALDQVQTSHILVVDMDFIPSDGLDKSVLRTVKTIHDGQNKNILDNRYALVVPAFERVFPLKPPCQDFHDCLSIVKKEGSDFIPQSMTSLRSCITNHEEGKCAIFHAKFENGHGPTKSYYWLKENDTQNVRSVPSFSDNYEPYVIIPWCPTGNSKRSFKLRNMMQKRKIQETWAPLSPYYDERFFGYGKNKIQQSVHLKYRGYAIYVIPAVGFLFHMYHEKTNVAQQWQNNHKESAMSFLFLEYINDLQRIYGKKNM